MITGDTYRKLVASCAGRDIVTEIPQTLVPLWCDDYYFKNPSADLVEVDLDESATTFTYIFDINLQRVVVSFGVPTYSKHRRDASRMAGHPLSNGRNFHRGHLMAHSIGGGMDINLVPQLGRLNIGEFRVLERKVRDLAEQNVRCLYFVRPIYATSTQTPGMFEQCVIIPPASVTYSLHKNI